MTSRREFFGLLAAAPLVAPAVVKELTQTKHGTLTLQFERLRGTAEEFGFRDWSADLNRMALSPRWPDNQMNYRLADGTKIWAIGDYKLPPDAIPNRLYGAHINADGDAV